MKIRSQNDYVLSGIVLLAAAFILLAVATLTDRGDLSSATLFLSGVACFLTAVFMLSFSRSEPVDTEIASLLPVAGMLNQCRICADLGVRGDAWFIPAPSIEGGVREFIPVQGIEIPGSFPDFSFLTDPGSPGVLLTPAAYPLIEYLERNGGLNIPAEEAGLISGLREICTDVLELAEKVDIEREGDTLVMTVRGYRLYPGCRSIAAESPKCCTMHPCGICSLTACLLARGLSSPWKMEHVCFDDRRSGFSVVFRGLPAPLPTGEGRDSSG
ncbi:MAG: hypothetical protein A4E42_01241 [Methanoregulaceae archaeon PtaU1.Bin222]|nr:MAG: hypothetical protein A4E42_01241 [Methanoregulaceae archaeon PtaU1.Bin222]